MACSSRSLQGIDQPGPGELTHPIDEHSVVGGADAQTPGATPRKESRITESRPRVNERPDLAGGLSLRIRRPWRIRRFARIVWAMKNAAIFAGLLLGALATQAAHGQTVTVRAEPPAETVTITEPGRIELAQLFKMSDVVAVARIVSGDTENYKTAIYKATVLTSFKGTADGQTIYFGPFIGSRLGREYVVFLRTAKEPAVPTTAPTAAYGTVKHYEVFNQGLSEMETSYECVFDGKDAQQCDDGVRVCTDYIVLPKGTLVSPSMDEVVSMGFRWVRKSKFIALLSDLAEQQQILAMPLPPRSR